MALVETLISQITDPALREALGREVANIKKRLNWGLVFERHIPETTRLLVAPIKPGSVVWERRSAKPKRFRVRAIDGDELVVVAEPVGATASATSEPRRIMRSNVLVEKALSEAVFPTLTSLGAIRNGAPDRPSHVVIQGENYHALELLLTAYEGRVDCIYLDPPYNTGERDWAYNNDYVDPNDQWRPSKWLAFMERRLRLGRRLLKPDGVMVVTIDEHEIHHLGMLLEQTFPEAAIQMASIVVNPIGQTRGGGLARVDEQAFFCFFGKAPAPAGHGDDFLAGPSDNKRAPVVRWERLLRGGEDSGRRARPSLFYPVLIDPARKRVVSAGPSMLEGDPDLAAKVEGREVAWPIRSDGSWGRWRIGQPKLQRLIDQGYVRLGGYDQKRRTWTVLYVADRTVELIDKGTIQIAGRDTNGVVALDYADLKPVSVKTIWNRGRHNAGIQGTGLLTAFAGERATFTYPKSLYAVEDTIRILTHDKPDALVLDFFAGSGTTLHATMLLNAEDGGRRRCVLVTNNELRAEAATRLNREGYFRGDPEFEAAGVFEAATWPRIRAALTGIRADGQPLQGAYLDEREYAEGFEENVEFFRIEYLDPVAVELGLCFAELHPLFWLTAGGVGARPQIHQNARVALAAGVPYAILHDPSGMPALLDGLTTTHTDITHVFIVADSDGSFADLASALPPHIVPIQLYRAYLETLRGATA